MAGSIALGLRWDREGVTDQSGRPQAKEAGSRRNRLGQDVPFKGVPSDLLPPVRPHLPVISDYDSKPGMLAHAFNPLALGRQRLVDL